RDSSRSGAGHNRAMSKEGAAPFSHAPSEGPGSDPFLQTPLQFLKGVGPRRGADLERAGLVTIEDLLYRFPLRYEDRSRLQSIASLKPGQAASISGKLLACGLRSTRRPGFKIFEAARSEERR